MTVGDIELAAREYMSVEQKVAALIPEIWPACMAAFDESMPIEDDITRVLVHRLQTHPRGGRLIGPIIFQFPLLEEDQEGDVVTKGIVDFAIILDNDDSLYLPFECKRLNVADGAGRLRSLADLYVDDGMMRYVCAKYAAKLPLGVMVGYVMDGDVISAEESIRYAVISRNKQLSLFGEPGNQASILQCKRLYTSHAREEDGAFFNIQHTLLPFPCPWTFEQASQPQEISPTPKRRRRLSPGGARTTTEPT